MRHVVASFALASLVACSSGSREQGKGAEPPPSLAGVTEVGVVPAEPFTLRYRIEGNGPPAVVVGSSIYYPRVFSSALRQSLRLVFLDHRGGAPPPAHPVDTTAYALDVLLDDIEHARQQLTLGRIIVIGHSGNSFLALEYAKKYPQHVSHVVMVGISPDLSEAHARARDHYFETAASAERKAILAANRAKLPDAELAKRTPRQRYVDTYIRETPRIWYNPTFDVRPIWEDFEVNVDMTDHVWGRIFRDIDITTGLDRFERPVLLMLGRYDFLLAPPSAWDPVKDKFRDLTIRIFEQSGHTPQYEEAALFDTVLLEWLRSRP
jgi:proline iminopeptidase